MGCISPACPYVTSHDSSQDVADVVRFKVCEYILYISVTYKFVESLACRI